MLIQKCDGCEKIQEFFPITITVEHEGSGIVWAGTSGDVIYGTNSGTYHFCSPACANEWFKKGFPPDGLRCRQCPGGGLIAFT